MKYSPRPISTIAHSARRAGGCARDLTVGLPLELETLDLVNLVGRQHLGENPIDTDLSPDRFARPAIVAGSITTSRPRRCMARTARVESSFTVSATPTRPPSARPTATYIGVLPASASRRASA